MDKTIDIGIVGAGRMGITHCSIVRSHPRVRVTAIADTNAVVNSVLEKYLDVRTYKDAARMVETEPLDALLVCTPAFLNQPILEAAARRGQHVFVEKPFVLSHRTGLELAERFEAARLVNQVGYVNRFNDVFAKARALVQEGVVGEVVRFRSEMYSCTVIAEEEDGSGWRSQRATGGGAAFEMAAHAIDLIEYFFGAPRRVAGTCLTSVFSRRVEDIVSTSLLFSSGLTGSLHVNWSDASYRKPTNKLEIFGKGGKILADQHGLKIHLTAADPARNLNAGWNSMSITDVFRNVPFFVRGNEFTAQLYHFIECITSGAPARCSFRDASATVRVIEDMFADAATLAGGSEP